MRSCAVLFRPLVRQPPWGRFLSLARPGGAVAGDQGGGKTDLPVEQRVFGFDALNDQFGQARAHGGGELIHAGGLHIEKIMVGDAAEAAQRELAGHLDLRLAAELQRPQGQQVVRRQHGGGAALVQRSRPLHPGGDELKLP